jgi:hypothetical protein
MTGAGECGEIRQALGVYLLGAISPADRSTAERHLARCAGCRAELAGLAALPGRLGSVPATDMTRMAGDERGGAGRGERPPGVPLQTLLDRAVRMRRHLRWRRLAVAAAAVVLVGGGAVAGSRVLYSPATRPVVPAVPWAATVTGSDPQTGMSATVRYLMRPWGLALAVHVSGISPGTRCELQVVDASGQDVPAGGWMVVAGDARAWYPASSSLPAADVRGFLITTGGKDLVSVSAAPAASAETAASAEPAASPGAVKTLAAAYLAIARPANHRLDTEVDGFTDHEGGNVAGAESDLRAEAATEQRFDRLLSEIRFPRRIAVTVRALIQANARRITLTLRQARSSSVTGLLSFADRHRAADAAVEAQVRVIRGDLGLPPPSDS